jgi:hypothetical protein
MIELGRTVKDRITGFTGVVTGHVVYISGCNQVLVAPPVDKDGKVPDSHWFDEQRVEYVGGERIVLDNTNTPGPDREAPKR